MRFVLVAVLLTPVLAYNPPWDKAGDLTVKIEGPVEITRSGAVPLKVVLENAGNAGLSGNLRMSVIDQWTISPASLAFQVEAHGSREYSFTVTAAVGSYNALYPIHAFADFSTLTAHAVLIVKTTFSDAPRAKAPIPWKPAAIAPDSGFALWRTPVRRVVLQVFGKDARTTPVGWDGTDAQTRATAQFGTTATRGDTRQSITMHEPYAQGAGTILVEYPLTLPRSSPIKLHFANATRDDAPGQTPGDGVTFRVRVLPFDAAEGKQGTVVFERHTAVKTWQEGEADLTQFAGQRVRVQLESHPGPRNNTTNDSSFWAEPTVIAGRPPAHDGGASGGRDLGSNIHLALGSRGLLDATVSFGHGLSFHGFQVRVLG